MSAVMRRGRTPIVRRVGSWPSVAALVVAAVGALFHAGCGLSPDQRTAVAKFSEAAATVADHSAREIVQVRTDVIATRTRQHAIARVFGELDEANERSRLDHLVELENAQPRLAAATAVADFANLLNTLATGDQTERFATATDRFLTSLQSVQGVNLSPEKAGAIGAIVIAAGRMGIESARANAIKAVVVETEEPIKTVIRQLQADLAIEASDTLTLTGFDWSRTLNVERRFAGAMAREITSKRPPSIVPSPSFTPDDSQWGDLHACAQEMLVDLDRRIADRAAASAELAKSFSAMDKAHDKLVIAVQTDQISIGTAIDAFATQAQELSRAIKILRD